MSGKMISVEHLDSKAGEWEYRLRITRSLLSGRGIEEVLFSNYNERIHGSDSRMSSSNAVDLVLQGLQPRT